MGTLNKSRPYATVYGQAGHAYEQDGKLFDHHGNEIGGPTPVGSPGPVVEQREPANEAVAPAPEEPQLNELDAVIEEANAQVPAHELTRKEIMEKLDALDIAYDRRARRSVLLRKLLEAEADQFKEA